MWQRVELKTRAKEVLKRNYWKAFLISFIIILVGGGDGSGGRVNFNNVRWNSNKTINFDMSAIIGLIIGVTAIAIIVTVLIRIFLGYILEVGARKFFVRAAEGTSDLNYIGFGFNGERYMDIIKAMLLRGVLIFLWTLLLIIPGIVKSYAYRMVPYILADNPNIGYSRAIELSNDMTMGHKFDIWVLDLSFIGWYFLGALALGIGTLFVRPYDDSTNAELYLVLREKAIKDGMCTCEELRVNSEDIFR